MKNHTKIFLKSRGCYWENMDPSALDIICEMCACFPFVDTNHVIARGMGGSKTKDYPDNLIGMCRLCHENFEKKLITKKECFDKIKDVFAHLSDHQKKIWEGLRKEV